MSRWTLTALPLLLLLAFGCPPQLNPDPVVPDMDDDDTDDPGDDDDTQPQAYVWVDPIELDFGLVDVQVQATGEVEVGNNGTGDLQIQSIVFSNTELFALLNGADFDVILGPGEVTELVIGFTPQWNGEASGTLVVATDDPIAPEVSVALRGTGLSGELQVEPISYDFGSTPIGCERTLEVTLANLGAPTLQVTAIDFEDGAGNGEMSMHHDLEFPLLIGAGIYPVEVRYLPIDTEPDSGTLSVHSNDPQGSPHVVSQFGLGAQGSSEVDSFSGDASTTAFVLSATPDPASLEVRLNTVPVFTGWTWDSALNAVVFDMDHVPETGDSIEAEYTTWGCEE